ncbi:DHHC palmitoyltransferase-domain-containing protein [Mycotypha africana]|uniref:DHHC palmitoyltransferase-domain-containing protein n=1 Tax=Mycotypha africana TaxID=64632 RepID=UPI0023006D5E|nr:DHHC palmitoyltransferase-domain-containing protein [Mycotypha africana]KAI8979585.1 DHHC palmitoyltransferase-domain-containing protein [Mycotypha africana]
MLEYIPGKLFVIVVVSLIAFIAYSSQLFLFLPAYGWWNSTSLMKLFPLNILVIMIFYNYYLAVITDPGKVPIDWEPPTSLMIAKEIPSEGITGPRYCKSCKRYKPPRSHHCRYCRRCVLRMDHHCPWINNCVGHDNYGHFIRFIVFANLACTYIICLLVGRVRYIMNAIRHFQFDAEPTTIQIVFMVLNFVLSFTVLFCVGILTCYQLYCLSRNQSNIEAHERSKVEKLVQRGKIPPIRYPFDVGFYKNICEVLGPQPLLWLWPQKAQGDGLTYPVIPGTDPRTPYYWPPRDPDDLRPSIFSSKYKHQQERNRRFREEHPEASVEEMEANELKNAVNEDDYYYDSGSFISDSEAEYSVNDEEEGMRHLINDRLYDLAGTYLDPQPTERQQPLYYNRRNSNKQITTFDDDDSDDDGSDSMPLHTLASRRKTSTPKND